MLKRFHTYPLLFSALAAAGGNDSKSFQVETGYDFLWVKAQAFVYDVNGLGVDPDLWPRLVVTLQDGSTQQAITTGETPIHSLFGSGSLPFILPAPHRIVGGATFNATVFNRHATVAYSVYLALSGVHVEAGAALPARLRRRAA